MGWSFCPHSMEQTEKCFRDREIYSQNHGQDPAIWVDVHSYWGLDKHYPYPGMSDHSFPQEVYLPSDMPAGRTTIRWLWICEQSSEIFLSCFDTEITAGGSSPNPLPRPNPKPYPKPNPTPAPSDQRQPEPEPEPAPVTAQCSEADMDVYNPWLGGCCAGLHQVEEDRPSSDPFYCASNSPKHMRSCWSTIEMCRPGSPSEPSTPSEPSPQPQPPQPEPEPEPEPEATPVPSPTPAPSTPRATGSMTCGSYDADDCKLAHRNANSNYAGFCLRCRSEGGANAFRNRCSLCCAVCSGSSLVQKGGLLRERERRGLKIWKHLFNENVLLQGSALGQEHDEL